MNKEKLLGLAFRSKEITIEGDKYLVKEMNAAIAQEYEASLYKIIGQSVKYDASKAKTNLVLLTLFGTDGNRIFEDKDFGLVEQLPAHVVDMVFQVASNLNNLDPGETEKN